MTVKLGSAPKEVLENVKGAFAAWQGTTRQGVRFEYTDGNGLIDVGFVEGMPGDALGLAKVKGDTALNIIQEAEVIIRTQWKGENLTGDDIFKIALHEVGHALGLPHIYKATGIMNPTLDYGGVPTVPAPTQDDAATMRTMYGEPLLPELVLEGSGLLLTGGNRSDITLWITAKNMGFRAVEKASITLEAGGETFYTRTVDLKAGGSESLTVQRTLNRTFSEITGQIEAGETKEYVADNNRIRLFLKPA